VTSRTYTVYVPFTNSLFKSAGIRVSHFFSRLPSTLKYLSYVEPVRIQIILCAMLLCSIAHTIICTRLFRGKMHSDWFNGIEILQGRWQHGEKVGYCYPRGLQKILCKWDIYVQLVTKGLKINTESNFYWFFSDDGRSNGLNCSMRSNLLSKKDVSLVLFATVWIFKPCQRERINAFLINHELKKYT
jgi:hypothetical protein